MRIMLREDYEVILPIIDKGDRLITAAYEAWDGKEDVYSFWVAFKREIANIKIM